AVGRARDPRAGRRVVVSRLGRGGVAGLAGAATLVAALTLLSRVVGVGRWGVQAATVGNQCVGSAYAAANAVPNVLYEVVAGGALAGAVVPLLAGAIGRGDREQVSRTASALLGWALAVLVPVAVLLAALSGPLSRALVPAGCEAARGATSLLLLTFAPQVLLYGVSVVLTGVLQAHHRFTWPALAPLLSSAVVVAVYVLYAVVSGSTARHPDGWLPGDGALLLLGLGTTLGVVALSLPLLVPASRAGVRLRPTLRFDDGVGRRALGLAGAGLAGLVAQQLVVALTLWLTRRWGGTGAFNAYQYAQAVYLLPYAVLAVPLATAAFPRLADRHAAGDVDGYRSVLTRSTRVVLVAGCTGAAVLVAVAPAVGTFFSAISAGGAGPALSALPVALTAFAPGLLGFALIAHLGRALFAAGAARWAARSTVAGWLLAAVLSVALVPALAGSGSGSRGTLLGLGLASSAGMTLAGGLLLLGAARTTVAGRPVRLPGVPRVALVAVLNALVAAAVGRFVADAVGGPGVGRSLLAAVLAAACCLLVLGAGLLVADRPDVDAVLRRGRMVP
ncbi:murein biosynthesis integral membrane protein MurJ, partial [Angustibacter aerolatus]